ncbi:MAG: cofactor-independent phosphoglycerate mutase [Clostridia bacterium]|nr:cofactor-independent phosphoglycerate mutase [Clostridia bacterium]
MKFIVVLGDGMADYKVDELGGRTPLECASKPCMDYMAKHGETGHVKNVPESLSPGSDVANLAAMGYDPMRYYSGRSPLEAVSVGVDMKDTDIIFRCNLVTVSDEENYEDKTVVDHSSDEITTEEARELIAAVNDAFANDKFSFYPGVSYRHIMVWDKGPYNFTLTPPHDILERKVRDYIPKGEGSELIYDMMVKSYDILNNHPVNLARAERGLKKANSIWIWGEGKKPLLSDFCEKFGLKGTVISAVDLIKGIGMCAGLDVVDVEGATGNVHTNYKGKADAALAALENGSDYVYIHLEGPDECGHRHEIENKVKAIELIDEKIVKYIKDRLEEKGIDYRMLILPDHPTPLKLRTHTRDSVPYIIYDSTSPKNNDVLAYTEAEAAKSGIVIEEGCKLMDRFII